MKKNDIRQSIINWNNKFHLDRWWRKKYNISYLSLDHRESSFYQQYYEFYEELIIQEYQTEKDKQKEEKYIVPIEYKPLSGNWWKGKEVTKKEIDDWFNVPI